MENNRYNNFWRRLAPSVGLFFLAPLVGEYLLGNISIKDIWALPFLAPMYGGGALLIREVTRRAGRGWPTLILLGIAYGLLEAGLIDQSLFNPSFEDHVLQDVAYIPALGVSAYNALAFIVGHAVWSIGTPIAIIETLVPARRTTPWLGKVGLLVTAVMYIAGSVFVFRDLQREEQFLASTPQLIVVSTMAVALIGISFAVGRKPQPKIDRQTPNPWLVGTLSFVISSLFFGATENWVGVAFKLLLLALMTAVIIRWSRCQGWGIPHRLALAGGALMTYAWGGFVLTILLGRSETIHLVGNAIFAFGAIVLLIIAARKTHDM